MRSVSKKVAHHLPRGWCSTFSVSWGVYTDTSDNLGALLLVHRRLLVWGVR